MIQDVEDEIRATYARQGSILSTKGGFGSPGFSALSQYGYVMECGFSTREEAEAYALEHYASRMHLITQH